MGHIIMWVVFGMTETAGQISKHISDLKAILEKIYAVTVNVAVNVLLFHLLSVLFFGTDQNYHFQSFPVQRSPLTYH